MQIPPGEIKKIKKLLLLNLIAADAVLLAGVLVNYFGAHKFQIPGFLLMILGIVWTVMTVSKMIKFKRFLSSQK